MNGLFLGLMGGSAAASTLVLGSFFAYIKNIFIKESLTLNKVELFIGLILFVSSIVFFDFKIKVAALFLCAFLGVLLVLIFNKFIIDILENNMAIDNPEDSKSYLFLLLVSMKSIFIGMSIGAVMLISNTGLNETLLITLLFSCILAGTVTGSALSDLGLDPVTATVAIVLIGIVNFVTGVVGGYIAQISFEFLPIILSLTSGIVMSGSLIKGYENIENSEIKRALTPKTVSVAMVTLVFIFHKEIV